jgi:transposase
MATATGTELTDEQWDIISPLLPPKAKTGRPRIDDRRILNGIFWVQRTGARWADVPREYGASSTCHARFQQWQVQGVWERIWRKLLSSLDEQGKLNWSKAHLDGCFIPAKKGAKLLA